jgi:hypothetical protein
MELNMPWNTQLTSSTSPYKSQILGLELNLRSRWTHQTQDLPSLSGRTAPMEKCYTNKMKIHLWELKKLQKDNK